MKLNKSLWEIQSEGCNLREKVAGTSPTAIPMVDIDSFVRIWRNRLDEAVARSDDITQVKANRILTFVKDNRSRGLSLLLWPAMNVTVIATSDLKSGVSI